MKRHLEFYKQCIETGSLPGAAPNGLCHYAVFEKEISTELFNFFRPTDSDCLQLRIEGKCLSYWASDLPVDSPGEASYFSPLRQNIVLFMAAMNNEL